MVKLEEDEKKLLKAALKAMANAYVLWGSKVGAVVLGEDGQNYEGCNVESLVSGLGTCAERCAIDHAVLHGNRMIRKVAIVADVGENSRPMPCGACLQYINDFAWGSKVKIVTATVSNGKILSETVDVKTLRELLPYPYKKRPLSPRRRS